MQSHRISAGALVERDGQILLVRHVLPGRYDFWVAPGGGVIGDESVEAAAAREVWEETGLRVRVGRLLYLEDLVSPERRTLKMWFEAHPTGGSLRAPVPDPDNEEIAEVAWLGPEAWEGKAIFPALLTERYARDREAGFPAPIRLPLRHMEFW